MWAKLDTVKIIKSVKLFELIFLKIKYPPRPMEMAPAATSAMPAVRMTEEATLAPERPAARANGTVSPSEAPIMMSRTMSPAVKCSSMWLLRRICFSGSRVSLCSLLLPAIWKCVYVITLLLLYSFEIEIKQAYVLVLVPITCIYIDIEIYYNPNQEGQARGIQPPPHPPININIYSICKPSYANYYIFFHIQK